MPEWTDIEPDGATHYVLAVDHHREVLLRSEGVTRQHFVN